MKPDQEGMHILKDLLDSHQLQGMSLLKGIELESIQDLLEECPLRELKKDDVLIKAGQPQSLGLPAPFRPFIDQP